jgi:uncharacterized protein
MRTIAIEEHFLADGFREMMKRAALSQRGGLNEPFVAERLAKLSDLGATRLKDMDAGGIDLQVISHTASGIVLPPGDEGVRLAREANDQLAAAVAAHPDRFAGFAALPMTDPEAAADELERTVRSLGFKGAIVRTMANSAPSVLLSQRPDHRLSDEQIQRISSHNQGADDNRQGATN